MGPTWLQLAGFEARTSHGLQLIPHAACSKCLSAFLGKRKIVKPLETSGSTIFADRGFQNPSQIRVAVAAVTIPGNVAYSPIRAIVASL